MTRLAGSASAAALNAPIRVELTREESDAIERAPRVSGTPQQIGLVKAVTPRVDINGLQIAADARGPRRGPRALAVPAPDGGFVWAVTVTSASGGALRLHLENVSLPAGAALFFYSRSGEAFGPYVGNGPDADGDLWTDTLFGTEGILQLHVSGPATAADLDRVSFSVTGVGIVAPRFAGSFTPEAGVCGDPDCVVDATCVAGTPAEPAKNAVAKMEWAQGAVSLHLHRRPHRRQQSVPQQPLLDRRPLRRQQQDRAEPPVLLAIRDDELQRNLPDERRLALQNDRLDTGDYGQEGGLHAPASGHQSSRRFRFPRLDDQRGRLHQWGGPVPDQQPRLQHSGLLAARCGHGLLAVWRLAPWSVDLQPRHHRSDRWREQRLPHRQRLLPRSSASSAGPAAAIRATLARAVRGRSTRLWMEPSPSITRRSSHTSIRRTDALRRSASRPTGSYRGPRDR
jgi:hypothetical protein